MSKVYVGSLPFSATETQLSEMFAKYGKVNSVNIVTDKYTNRSRGFAFVEMETEEAAQKAIAELNGSQFEGRTIIVNPARPQERRERSFDKRDRGGRKERSGPSRRW
ncbi:MAG: RNA recognition motif domain-containing protein [bacterium]|nr:RNA-binding protein [candidate division WOR-3 bacterium]MDH5683828.1 RNA-binding protein [candidate division WOR-3 bacterium]